MVMIGGDEQWRLEGYRVVAAGRLLSENSKVLY
jgi:hypothetical protein